MRYCLTLMLLGDAAVASGSDHSEASSQLSDLDTDAPTSSSILSVDENTDPKDEDTVQALDQYLEVLISVYERFATTANETKVEVEKLRKVLHASDTIPILSTDKRIQSPPRRYPSAHQHSDPTSRYSNSCSNSCSNSYPTSCPNSCSCKYWYVIAILIAIFIDGSSSLIIAAPNPPPISRRVPLQRTKTIYPPNHYRSILAAAPTQEIGMTEEEYKKFLKAHYAQGEGTYLIGSPGD